MQVQPRARRSTPRAGSASESGREHSPDAPLEQFEARRHGVELRMLRVEQVLADQRQVHVRRRVPAEAYRSFRVRGHARVRELADRSPPGVELDALRYI